MLPQVESTATQVERVGLILSRSTQLIFSDPGSTCRQLSIPGAPKHARQCTHTQTRTHDTSRALAVCAIHWRLRHTACAPRAQGARAPCAKPGPRHAATRPLSLLLLRRATHSRMHTRRLQEAPPMRHAAVDAHALTYSLCTQGGEKVRSNQRTAPAHAGVQMCVAAGKSEERTARLSGHEWRAAVGVPT